MNNEFEILYPENNDDPRILRTDYYEVSDIGFKKLIDYVVRYDKLPTSKSLNITEELADKASDIYSLIRFYEAFNKMNNFVKRVFFDAYTDLLDPINKNIKVLSDLKLLTSYTKFNSILGIKVVQFNNYKSIGSWAFEGSLSFPEGLTALKTGKNISVDNYPYLNDPQYKELVDMHTMKLRNTMQAAKNLQEKAILHKGNIYSAMTNVSTTNQFLKNAPSCCSKEFKALRLALDSAKAISVMPYGSGNITKFYSKDTLERIYEDNDFSIELNIIPLKEKAHDFIVNL